MIFNSYVFLLLLLPLSLLIYYTLNKRQKYSYANWSLIIISLIFYGYFNWYYVLLLLIHTSWNFIFGKILTKSNKKRKFILGVAILGNLLLLFYFKYMNFFIMNMNGLLHTEFNLISIILPLGISFFTFQQIAYLVDVYYKRIDQYSLEEFFLSSVYFPKISQGPITLHQEFIPQLRDKKNRTYNYENLSKGLYMFTLGLSKKVLLADVFGNFVTAGYNDLYALNSTSAILVMLSYTMQIYFDFSGYSDMARGISAMFNLNLPQNFNSPYKALSIQDFWNRWHMSLTNFLTRYIYIPLGGNRKGKQRTLINIMIVFLVSGVWHGANWTFIIWGALHGIWSVIQRVTKAKFSVLHPAFNWIITFAFVNIAWIFFRSPTLNEAMLLIKTIVSCNFGSVSTDMLLNLLLPEINFIFRIANLNSLMRISPYIVLFGSILSCLSMKNTDEKVQSFRLTWKTCVWTSILLVWCILSFSSITTFIYFNF